MIRRYSLKDGKDTAGRASVVIDGNVSKITIISIDNAYRGKGLGAKLLKKLIDREFSKGANTIKLECRPDNSRKFVKDWYERLGFRDTGEGSWMELKK